MRQDTLPGHGVVSPGGNGAHPVVMLPDASFLLYGELSRSGFDLVITNPDGHSFVVADYFSFNPPPALMIAGGAALTPQAVAALMPHAFGDVMYAGPVASGAAQPQIGTVRFVHGNVTVERTDGTVVHAKDGTPIYKGDHIHTGHDAFVNIRMMDNTKLNLGHDADTVIQNYQFEPAQQTGHFDVLVRVGGFKYQSGTMGTFGMQHPHTVIHTPSAIISVRGSTGEGTVTQDGQTIFQRTSNGIFDITDINGQHQIRLSTEGNTGIVTTPGGEPHFSSEPTPKELQLLHGSLPPLASDQADQVIDQQDQQNQQNAPSGGGQGGAQSGGPGGEQAGHTQAGGHQNQGTGEGSQGSGPTATESTSVNTQSPLLTSQTYIDQGAHAITGSSNGSLGELLLTTGPGTQSTPGLPLVPPPVIPQSNPLPPPDHPPVANPDTASLTAGQSIDLTAVVLANDSDPDAGQTPHITAVGTLDTLGTVSLSNGTLTYTANNFAFLGQGQTTKDVFTYTITSGGLTASSNVTLTVTGVNDPPVAHNDAVSTTKGTPVVTPNVLANDTDPDTSDSLSILSFDTSNTKGTVTANGNGTFTYNPSGQFATLGQGAVATDSFTYKVTDNHGATSSATVTITINGVNDPPVATPDVAGTDQNTVVTTGNVLANDTDLNGDTLSVQSVNTTGTVGVVTNNGNGTFSYDPAGHFNALAAGQQATDTFHYTVSDGHGGTSTAAVTVTIAGLNDPPVAVADSAATTANLAVTTVNVLANDTDAEGDTLSLAGLDTTNTKGLVTNNGDGTFTYDPNGQFNALPQGQVATDTFVYKVSDGHGGSASGTVTVDVTGVPPVAVGNTYTTSKTSVLTGNLVTDNTGAGTDTGFHAGDTFQVNGAAVTVGNSVTLASGASVTIAADGTLTYDPTNSVTLHALPGGQTATDTFTYSIVDGTTVSNPANVSIQVTGSSLPPLQYLTGSGPAPIDNQVTIVGNQSTPLGGALVAPQTVAPRPLVVVSDPGGTSNSIYDQTPLVIPRSDFGVSHNPNVLNDALPTITIQGELNGPADPVDAFQVDLKPGETLVLDVDGAGGVSLGGNTQIYLYQDGKFISSSSAANTFLDTGSFMANDPFLAYHSDQGGHFEFVIAGAGAVDKTTGNFDPATAPIVDYTLQTSIIPASGTSTTTSTVSSTQTLSYLEGLLTVHGAPPGSSNVFGQQSTIIDERAFASASAATGGVDVGQLGDNTVVLQGGDQVAGPGSAASKLLIDRGQFGYSADSTVTNGTTTSRETITIEGNLSSGNTSDNVSINLKAGDVLTLDVDQGHVFGKNVDTVLTVYGTTGNIVNSNDDSPLDPGSVATQAGSTTTHDAYLRVTATTTGTYRVEISAHSAGDSGGYRLNASLDTTNSSPPAGGFAAQAPVFVESPPTGPDLTGVSQQSVLSASLPAGFESYQTSDGSLFVYGNGLPADYQSILQSASYENMYSNPAQGSTLYQFSGVTASSLFTVDSRAVNVQSSAINLDNVGASNGSLGAYSGSTGTGNQPFQPTSPDGGDFNGDGMSDLIVQQSSLGVGARVIMGNQPASGSLDGGQGFDIYSSQGTVYNVQFAGDLNGDGYTDIVGDTNDGNGKHAFVVFGSATLPTGPVDVSSTNPAVSHGFILDVAPAGGYTTDAVVPIGDINGDGFGDLLSVQYSALGSAFNPVVVFGRTDFTASIDVATNTMTAATSAPGSTLTFDTSALNANDNTLLHGKVIDSGLTTYLGHIAGVGDINGDGFSDLGATISIGYSNPGPVLKVMYGTSSAELQARATAAGGLFNPDTQLAGGGAINLITDPQGQGHISSFSSAGDVNGDGYGDLLVKVDQYGSGSFAGTYVVFGGPTLQDFAKDLNGAGLFLSDLGGPQADGSHGFRLVSSEFSGTYNGSSAYAPADAVPVGDINGDGFSDLGAAASSYGLGYNKALGTRHIIYGGPSFELNGGNLDIATASPSQSVAIEPGFATPTNPGNGQYTASAVGDFNGDGIGDFAVTNRYFDQNAITNTTTSVYNVYGILPGRTYVVFGKQSASGVTGLAGQHVTPQYPTFAGLTSVNENEHNTTGENFFVGPFAGETTLLSVAGTPVTGSNQTITLASGATVTVNPDGTFTYDANPTGFGSVFQYLNTGEHAAEKIPFTARSGTGTTTTSGTLVVDVTGISTPPTVTFGGAGPLNLVVGQHVAIAGPSFSIDDVDSNFVTSADITVTGSGGLSLDSKTLPTDINRSGSSGSVTSTISLTGAASMADYVKAIESIRFSDNSATGTVTPVITVTVHGEGNGATATATTTVALTQAVDALTGSTSTVTTTNTTTGTMLGTVAGQNVIVGNFDDVTGLPAGGLTINSLGVVGTGKLTIDQNLSVNSAVDISSPFVVLSGASLGANSINIGVTRAGEVITHGTSSMSAGTLVDVGSRGFLLVSDGDLTINGNVQNQAQVGFTSSTSTFTVATTKTLTINGNLINEALFGSGSGTQANTLQLNVTGYFDTTGGVIEVPNNATLAIDAPTTLIGGGTYISTGDGTGTAFVSFQGTQQLQMMSDTTLINPAASISFDGDITVTGAYTLYNDTRIAFTGDTLAAGATLQNNGQLVITGPVQSTFDGHLVNNGVMQVIDSSAAINEQLINKGDLKLGTTSTSASTLQVSGEITNAGRLESVGNNSIAGRVINQGQILVDAGTLGINNAGHIFETGAGGINVAAGATLTISDGAIVVGDGTRFTGGGTVELTGSTMLMVDGGPTVDLNVTLAGDNLQVVAPLELNGQSIVSGTGTITMDGNPLVVDGVLQPGQQTGTLTINGDLQVNDSGGVGIDIGGTAQGNTYDLLQVNGTANLSGVMKVDLVNSYLPNVGDSFTILTANAVNGRFLGFQNMVIDAARVFDPVYTGTGVSLNVVGVTQAGTTGSDTLTLTAGADVVVGLAGNDVFQSIGSGDTAFGGAGADVFQISDTSFHHIDGGDGTDSLAPMGAGLNLDLTTLQAGQVDGIERIDMSVDPGNQTVTLDENAVLDLTDGRSSPLYIDGNVGDRVVLNGDFRLDDSNHTTVLTTGRASVQVSDTVVSEIHFTSGYELLLGSLGAETLTGTAGKDVIIGHGGADTISAGGGNDFVFYNASEVLVDGGTGTDTLAFENDGQTLDLTTTPTQFTSIERVDLSSGGSGGGTNTLSLSISDIWNGTTGITELTNLWSTNPLFGAHQFLVDGSAHDKVILNGIVLANVVSTHTSDLSAAGITEKPVTLASGDYMAYTQGSVTLFVSDTIFNGDLGNLAPQSFAPLDDVVLTGSTQSLNLLAGTYDPNHDPLNVTGYTGTNTAQLSIVGNNLNVNATSTGTFSRAYTLSDGLGGSTTNTVTVRVVNATSTAGASASFDAPTLWVGNIPGPSDVVLINQGNSVTTTATITRTVNVLDVDGGGAFTLSTGTLITNTLLVGPTGTVTVASGETLTVNQSARFEAGAVLSGSGTIDFAGPGNINLPGGFTLTNGPAWVLSSSEQVVGNALTIGAGGALVQQAGHSVIGVGSFNVGSGGLLTVEGNGSGSADLQVNGDLANSGFITLDNVSATATSSATLNLDAGTLANAGTLVSANSGNNTNGGARSINGIVTNTGTINVNYTLSVNGYGGDLTNNAGANINVAAFQSLIVSGNAFVNDGTITLAPSATGTDPNIGAIVSGTILDVTNSVLVNDPSGIIQGFGTIAGSLVNNGTNNLGHSPGMLAVNGDYTNGDKGNLKIQIGGNQPGVTYDQLVVSGQASLGGVLDVSMWQGFTPAVAAGYVILMAGSVSGSFASATGLDVSHTQVLDLGYLDNQVVLTSVAVSQAGTSGDDALAGTPGTDVIVAGAGNDVIAGVGLHDIVYGQAGNDTIDITQDGFKRVDGGDGVDTLHLAPNVTLDNINGTTIDHVEVLDLRNGAADKLELDANRIDHMVDGHNALTGTDNSLVVRGDIGDKIVLQGDFSQSSEQTIRINGENVPFRVFSEGHTSLFVGPNLSVEVDHTDGSVANYAALGTVGGNPLGDSIDLTNVSALGNNTGPGQGVGNQPSLHDVLSSANHSLDSLLGPDSAAHAPTGPPVGGGEYAYHPYVHASLDGLGGVTVQSHLVEL